MIAKLADSQIIQSSPEAKILLKTSDYEIIHLCLKKGEILNKHTNQLGVIFYVIQGNGSITVNDDSFAVEKDDLISIKPNIERSWKNIGKDELRILVLKDKKISENKNY